MKRVYCLGELKLEDNVKCGLFHMFKGQMSLASSEEEAEKLLIRIIDCVRIVTGVDYVLSLIKSPDGLAVLCFDMKPDGNYYNIKLDENNEPYIEVEE